MRVTMSTAVLVLLIALCAPTMVRGDSPQEIEGEVVQITQQTGNAGELDTLMIRTRQGEPMRLALGEAGSSEGRVRVGDRIAARLCEGEPNGQGYAVQSMKVRRTGETLQYRDASGQMLQTRSRIREHAQDGTGPATRTQSRTRARIHEPGTGNCPNGGGSRGNRGGGGGRR